MYYLINFELESGKGRILRYPLPQTIDLAVLDESFVLQDIKQFLFPELANSSDRALLDCWSVCLETIVDIITQTEKRFLIFPTDKHLQIFHIIKQKCKLRTRSSGNVSVESLIASGGTSFGGVSQKHMTIKEMISITRAAGVKSLTAMSDAVPLLSKEDKAKIGIITCGSYSHIVDTRTGVFHRKDSSCLQGIPVSVWQGIGKKPIKSGFTPCPFCYMQQEKAEVSVSSSRASNAKKDVEKRLIDGAYAVSDNIIARCHLLAHRGYLTKNLIKSHKCIAKKCPFFEKLKPEYWQAFEKNEQDRKGTQVIIDEQNLSCDRDALIRETLEDSGCIYVTSIREETWNFLVISYIYDRKVDLSQEIRFLRKKLGKVIKLQARTGTDIVLEKLIRKPRREMRRVTDLLKAPGVGVATKSRLMYLGVYCLEDLFGRNADALYELDCYMSRKTVSRRYLTAYHSAVKFANEMELISKSNQKACIDKDRGGINSIR